jgi:hypothetical protein
MSQSPEPRIDFVVRHLRAAMPRRWPEISRVTGVPEKTICKIAYRETLDPRTSTTEALHNYFTAIAPAAPADQRSPEAVDCLELAQPLFVLARASS